MKHWFLALLMLLLFLPCMAGAETAQDITAACIINGREFNAAKPEACRDANYNTVYTGKALTIEAPADQQIGAVLLKWRMITPIEVALQADEGGEWVEFQRAEPGYAAQYIPLDTPQTALRLEGVSAKMELCEVQVFTPGEPGPDVQVWRDPPEKVDLMLFSTHPDDEVLWFGGLLPLYAGEKGMDVLVVNAVYGWYYRRLELLDALWTCGVDIYPVMLNYPDVVDTIAVTLDTWEINRRNAKDRTVALIRQYQPDVVVLHDVEGEYGHNAHKAFSQLGRQAVERAADGSEHPESAEAWGVWDVPKTYIHLWGENQLRMDWKQPLTAFDGKTGLEVAAEAFWCHVSQRDTHYRVHDGGEYDNALFGLWRTTVGEDLVKNDLFENIPLR